jgi:N-acetylglucosaminyldiphosphoundecaprenol N-acetyl-beta-D-mannosaminyltransferase
MNHLQIFVLFCLGAPKQEIFINRYKDAVCAKVMIGLGGSIDVFAGNVKGRLQFSLKQGLNGFIELLKSPNGLKEY